MWAPLKKIIKKNKTNKQKLKVLHSSYRIDRRVRRIFFYFFLFSYFSDLRSFDRRISSGQTRKVLYATRATRENKKHGISPRIQVKIRKNPSF